MGRPKKKKTQAEIHKAYNDRQKALRQEQRERYLKLGSLPCEHFAFNACKENHKQFLRDQGMEHLIWQRMGWQDAWIAYLKEKERRAQIDYELQHNTPIVVYDKEGNEQFFDSMWDAEELFDYRKFNTTDEYLLYFGQYELFDEMLELLKKKGEAHYSPYTVKFKEEISL